MSIRIFYFRKNIVIPTRNPVNPFPDLTKWDPEDYHDVAKIHEVS